MTQDNRIWVLMSRRLSGEASPAELDELQQLFEQSPDKHYLFDLLHSYFTARPVDVSHPAADEDTAPEARFRRIVDKPDDHTPDDHRQPRKQRTIRLFSGKAIGYAASFAALLVLGWSIFRILPGQKASPPAVKPVGNKEVLAKAGARTRLLLPDGTQVWLNSNSRLKYNNEFNIKNREVGLEGEAYFDVTRDMEHPFIVHASSLDIKALGTSFTIKSYPQDETEETTLLKGIIEVSRKGILSTARIILKPNEKLVFNKLPAHAPSDPVADPSTAKHPAGMAINSIRQDVPDSEKVETSWMYDRLVFNGDNFRELANKMERWYDVHILVKDDTLNHYHFGGVFANESIEEALKDLQLTADFSYKINGKEIELFVKR